MRVAQNGGIVKSLFGLLTRGRGNWYNEGEKGGTLMANDDEIRLQKRFVELAEKAYQQNIYLFSDFLGLGEQTLFYQVCRQFAHVPYTMFGGHEACERVMVRFGSADMMGYEEEFPIVCLEIRPAAPKFAEALTHRDYLGTLMGLGIERSVMGDIFVAEKGAYVYCQDTMAEYICENLSKVKHTIVTCRQVDAIPEEALPHLVERIVNVASERLDVILAAVYNLSRNQVLELFRAGKVFVGGRLYENNSGQPKEGDVISLRGFGRFVYGGVTHETKKGRYMARVQVYQ